jgi:uncharacterized protein (TIGR03437 family)
MKKLFAAPALLSLPCLLFSFPSGPEIRRTGAPIDGGQDCSVCHNSYGAANSDPRGSIQVLVQNYRPGVKQTIRVTVQHPEGRRWGFQLTARQANDESKQAGTFTPTNLIRVRCDPAGDAPCNGSREFASHNLASTQPSVPQQGAWFVEWTPPGDDVGDLVFYAAGNAAGDPVDSNQGDRIYTTRVAVSNEGSCALVRKPFLQKVTNSGSFQTGGAMNTLISLFGLDFQVGGIKRSVTFSDLEDGKFPTTLGCVAVEVAGRRAPIHYVQTDLINAQAPTASPGGPVDVRVILNPGQPNEQRSDVAIVNFGNYSPAFFTFLPSTTIAAVFAGTGIPVANPAVVSTGRPARNGEIISMYGTGFGPTEPVYQAGEITPGPAPLRDPYRITIGGVTLAPADIFYAGLAPLSISGLYQFDVRIPQLNITGNIPVSIEIGGVRTQDGATIPVVQPPPPGQ